MSNLQNIPIHRFPGIIILGGGVSGCAAAIGAARAGAKVFLLERSISLGGMSTGGLIAAWNGYRPEFCPLTAELDWRVSDYLGKDIDPGAPLRHDILKICLEQWLHGLNIDFWYESQAVDAEVQDDVVTGVYLMTPTGLELWRAPLFIDATGDGVFAMAAGVPFQLGRPADNFCQGASISFEIGGISTELDIRSLPQSFGQHYAVPAGDLCQLAQEHLTSPAGHVLLHPSAEPGVATANMTNAVQFDCTSAKERTAAIQLCRRQMTECIQFLQKYLPGFEQCYLHRSAEQFGIRESRHFQGMVTVTDEDIRANRVFPDWISTRNLFGFDLHNVSGSGLDPDGVIELPDCSRYGYTIPLRACLPIRHRHLLLCGRNISGTHLAHSSFRVMPICMNIGLGVGVTAASALQYGKELMDVEIVDVQKELIRQGVSQP